MILHRVPPVEQIFSSLTSVEKEDLILKVVQSSSMMAEQWHATDFGGKIASTSSNELQSSTRKEEIKESGRF